jgi:hypothetical protein
MPLVRHGAGAAAQTVALASSTVTPQSIADGIRVIESPLILGLSYQSRGRMKAVHSVVRSTNL